MNPLRDAQVRSLCLRLGLPAPQPEFVFAPPRKWALDYAFITAKVALEIEGGVWVGGRHVQGSGFSRDLEKYNTLACMGWLLVRVTPEQVEDGALRKWLEFAMRCGILKGSAPNPEEMVMPRIRRTNLQMLEDEVERVAQRIAQTKAAQALLKENLEQQTADLARATRALKDARKAAKLARSVGGRRVR